LSIDGVTEKTSSAKVRKLLNYTVYIICIKDLISISSAKFYYIISTVKFHMQFEMKTIVPIPNAYVYISNIYIQIYIVYIYIYFNRMKDLITKN